MLFGILLMICGVIEAIIEIEDVEKGFFEAHHTIVFLSMLIIIRALGTIMVGISRFNKAMTCITFFKVFKHWIFEVILSIVIILAGISELIEYLEEDHTGDAGSVWFYAMIIWGIMKLTNCILIIIKTMLLSLMTLQEIENETNKKIKQIQKIDKILRNPSIERGVVILLVVFCIIEEFITVSSEMVTEHRIFLVYGVLVFIKQVATFSDIIEILDDTVERQKIMV